MAAAERRYAKTTSSGRATVLGLVTLALVQQQAFAPREVVQAWLCAPTHRGSGVVCRATAEGVRQRPRPRNGRGYGGGEVLQDERYNGRKTPRSREPDPSAGDWRQLQTAAIAQSKEGNYAAARLLFQDAIFAITSVRDTDKLRDAGISLRMRLAGVNLKLGKTKDAIKDYKAVLKSFSEWGRGDTVEAAGTRVQLGQAWASIGGYSIAIRQFLAAKGILELLNLLSSSKGVKVLSELGATYVSFNILDQALVELQGACFTLFPKGPDQADFSSWPAEDSMEATKIFMNLGTAHMGLARASSTGLSMGSLEILQKAEADRNRANGASGQDFAKTRMDQHIRQGLVRLKPRTALLPSAAPTEHRMVAAALCSLVRRLLEAHGGLRSKVGLQMLMMVGELYAEDGYYKNALETLEEAWALVEEGTWSSGLDEKEVLTERAQLSAQLATAHELLGNSPEAARLRAQALQDFLDADVFFGSTLPIPEVKSKESQATEAEAAEEEEPTESVELVQAESRERPARKKFPVTHRLKQAAAALLQAMGQADISVGQSQRGLMRLEAAKIVLESVGLLASKEGAQVLTTMGDVHLAVGTVRRALASYEHAFKVYEKLGGDTDLYTETREANVLKQKLASVQQMLGIWVPAKMPEVSLPESYGEAPEAEKRESLRAKADELKKKKRKLVYFGKKTRYPVGPGWRIHLDTDGVDPGDREAVVHSWMKSVLMGNLRSRQSYERKRQKQGLGELEYTDENPMKGWISRNLRVKADKGLMRDLMEDQQRRWLRAKRKAKRFGRPVSPWSKEDKDDSETKKEDSRKHIF